jgi:hypothetical protein
MTEFLDELARSMAGSMPRQRALRLLGGAFVGIAVPGLATTKARAAPRFHTCVRDGGFVCQCPSIRGLFYKICCAPAADYDCKCKAPPAGYAQCKKRPCTPCGRRCCSPSEYCASRNLELCCETGHPACGRRCCSPNEECVRLHVGGSTIRECNKRCPPGQVWCDEKKCCPRGMSCVFGPTGWQCRRCNEDQVQCGTKCCPKQTPRCCGAECCPKTLSCCSGACADTKSDPRNCGSCGNVCESGVCGGGICAFP